MSKAGKKPLKSADEAKAVAREGIKAMRVTRSCGCVFCDLDLFPDEDGFHRGRDFEVECDLRHK